MGSKRALLGSMVGVLLVATGVAGCSPGTSTTTGNAGGNDPSGSGDPDSSSATFIISGSGSTGSGVSNCTDPTCVGATPQGGCDGSLPIDSGDAIDGARAMGLCKIDDGSSWGVVSANWVRADGQPLTLAELQDGKGILSGFGPVTPREGSQMLVLSSGAARSPVDPGYQAPSGYWKDFNPHGSPPGYPKESPACPGVITGEPYDSAGLSVRVKTPTDAKSLSFNLDFYTYEFPNYICDQYNDFFVAMMNPKPAGLADANISFDPDGNTISVNAGFLDVCTAQVAGGKNFVCSQGTGDLNGTGFEGAAATGWLETKAPIDAPGTEITLLFAIWDSGDGVLDSTVLIDNFKFEADGTTTGTQPIPQ